MKLRKFISMFMLSLTICSMGTVTFASELNPFQLQLTSIKTEQGILEGFILNEDDIDYILTHGNYSSDGQNIEYQNNIFNVQTLKDGKSRLERSNNTPQVKGTKFQYKRSSLFYSRGSQHRLGAITLDPGQSGSIEKGESYSYEVNGSVSGSIKDIFELELGGSYSKEYTVTTTHNLENTTSKRVTYVLSAVFEIHEYDVYDTGIFGNNNDYIGSLQYYEPFSSYIYEY